MAGLEIFSVTIYMLSSLLKKNILISYFQIFLKKKIYFL